MIEINLLPQALRKKAAFRLSLPKKYLQGIALLVVGVVFCAQILLQAIIFAQGLMLSGLQKRMSGIQPRKQVVDALKVEVQKYTALEDLLKREKTARLRGGPLLNFISGGIPDGVWLAELSFSGDGAELKGSCFSAAGSEMAQIGEFLRALKQDARLSAIFAKLELSSVQRKKLGPTEVVEFIIGSSSKKKAPSGAKKK